MKSFWRSGLVVWAAVKSRVRVDGCVRNITRLLEYSGTRAVHLLGKPPALGHSAVLHSDGYSRLDGNGICSWEAVVHEAPGQENMTWLLDTVVEAPCALRGTPRILSHGVDFMATDTFV